MDIKIIAKNEISQAAEVLTLAFQSDPFINWICVDKSTYMYKAPLLFAAWIKYSIYYGYALRTENFAAVALRHKGNTSFTFWRLLRSGMLKTKNILGEIGFARLLEFSGVIEQERKYYFNSSPYLYCWLLGTKPDLQGQGFGRMLMQYTFALAKAENLPCYLETTTLSARKVHLHNGYNIIKETPLADSDVIITTMIKQA